MIWLVRPPFSGDIDSYRKGQDQDWYQRSGSVDVLRFTTTIHDDRFDSLSRIVLVTTAYDRRSRKRPFVSLDWTTPIVRFNSSWQHREHKYYVIFFL